jgi:Universal stress protein family
MEPAETGTIPDLVMRSEEVLHLLSRRTQADEPANLETTMRLHTILASVDFSEPSHEALCVASDMARDANAQLHLVRVVPMPIYEAWSVDAPAVEAAGLTSQLPLCSRHKARCLPMREDIPSHLTQSRHPASRAIPIQSRRQPGGGTLPSTSWR